MVCAVLQCSAEFSFMLVSVLFVPPQLRYQKCLDARPPSGGGSCLPGPPADSVARRVGSSVRKGVQSLLGSFRRSGSQTP